MGQQEVLDFLKQHKKSYFSAKDISERTGINVKSIRESLKRLRRTQYIAIKDENRTLSITGQGRWIKLYKHKN